MIVKPFLRSVRFALRGFVRAVRGERNIRIEIICACAIVLACFIVPFERWERVALIGSVGFVLSMELVNTAVEYVLDLLKPKIHPFARVAKDVAAAAVLVASFTAFLIGLLILVPYLQVVVARVLQ